MRTHRDELLARAVPELDLILGGHDHHTLNHEHHDTLLKKSGTDFREFSIINLSLHEKEKSEFKHLKNIITEENSHELESGVVVKNISAYSTKHKTLIAEFKRIEITSEFPRDPELHEAVVKYSEQLNDKMKGICAYVGVDIIGLFTKIRHEETNWANMICDMINEANKTDITLIN
jgi:5'-nucleotidase